MNDCGCNASFLCLTHRFEGRIGTGNSSDSNLMAQNDDMSEKMTDCPCHAGKICGIHVDEVMENLNKAAWGTKITEDNIECDDHVKMEGKHIGKIVGRFYNKDTPHLTKAEKIERDILDELSTLRQKVADMETAKAFQVSILDNVIQRLGQTEDVVQKIGKLFERVLELQESCGRSGRS